MAKEKHSVEVHIGKDVFAHDYGSADCAWRAIDRLKESIATGAINVRYWAGKRLDFSSY